MDTLNGFSTSTFKYTPTIAGTYFFTVTALLTASAFSGGIYTTIEKNGAIIAYGSNVTLATGTLTEGISECVDYGSYEWNHRLYSIFCIFFC